MASDKQQFDRALNHYNKLHEDGLFSAPADEGEVAIFVSLVAMHTPELHLLSTYRERFSARRKDNLEFRRFTNEANDIADIYRAKGRVARVFIGAEGEDLDDAIKDPAVSDIVTIGHGTLSSLNFPGTPGYRYDWRRAAELTTHLKTGRFIQRQCGVTKRRLNVPLGLFVTQRPEQTWAAVGINFDPKNLRDPANKLVKPVFKKDTEITLEAIESLRQAPKPDVKGLVAVQGQYLPANGMY